MKRPLALISGGTSGIGLATAQRLVADYRLALVYARNPERAHQVEQAFADPDSVKTFALDVGDDPSVEAGYEAILTHFGQSPEVLINSAGVASFQKFFVQSRDLSLVQDLMNINYFGALRLIHKVLPSMYSRRKGCIVNLSSVSGLGGSAGVIGYAESKAALRCLSQNLAMEVAHRGVSVHCICPGRVESPMTETLLQQFKPASINYPLGRALRPDEVARCIEFLIQMGPALNGQNLILDGGTSLARIQASKPNPQV